MATCAEATRYTSETARIFTLQIQKDKSTIEGLRSAMSAQASFPRSADAAIATARCISGARANGLIEEAFAADASQRLSRAAVVGNESGGLAFLASHDFAMIPVLLDPQPQDIIFSRSLSQLKTGSQPSSSLVNGLMQMVQSQSAQPHWIEEVGRALPLVNLSIDQLRESVAPLFPEYAEQAIRAKTIPAFLSISPEDPLLQHDLQARLSMHPELVFVDTAERARMIIRVNRLQFEEVDDPERRQTITYADYQVNLLAAALLMPKNASYLFDHVSGRAVIEYAFKISVELDGGAKSDRLLRDRIERTYSICSNARIQNVFGGVQPATFQANAEMERLCAGRSSVVRARDLRPDVLERLVAEIESLPVVANRIGTRFRSCESHAYSISDAVERDEALSECFLQK